MNLHGDSNLHRKEIFNQTCRKQTKHSKCFRRNTQQSWDQYKKTPPSRPAWASPPDRSEPPGWFGILQNNNNNNMELLVSAKLAHSKFHGIPWNCSCQRNWPTPSSMAFHGTARVSEIGPLQVPWNSMEFHGTARVIEIGALEVPWNSMELLVSSKLAHSNFHGIPWNCSCQRNWPTPRPMEFHGTAGVCEIGAPLVPWNSLEFPGAARVIEIGALQVACNSM